MSWITVRKELNKLSKEQVIEVVGDFYKKSKSLKEMLDFYAEPKEDELFQKYRQKVYEAFYPKRGFDYKLKNGKQAINDFKKLGASIPLVADLMLFYVETGVSFTNDFGDISEVFYNSLESTYLDALNLMKRENILDEFKDRAAQVLADTKNIGWGFYDSLSHSYFQFYGIS